MNARERRRSDLVTLLAAISLLLAVAAGWWAWTTRARVERRKVLAGVPEFPQPGQVSKKRAPPPSEPGPRAEPVVLKKLVADAGPAPVPKPPIDRMTAFALAPASTVTMVQVNALFNTPMFERFRECAPQQFRDLEKGANEFGLDLERDIDRVTMVPEGMAMSGSFEGKPLAETLARRGGKTAESRTYRDQTVWTNGNNCVVQMGNFMLMGRASGCENMVDRALDPPAESANPEELYGDVYMRSDLSRLRGQGSSDRFTPQESEVLGGLVDSLSGVTVRANVWDQVALSFEGNPKKPDELRQLSSMARGAMSLVKNQLSDDDVKLQALADLSNVRSEDGKVKLDLALPADDLFERLHLPCPGREVEDAGVP